MVLFTTARFEQAAAVPHLKHVWADQGYTGSGKAWTVAIVRRTPHARGEWRPIGDLNDLSTLRFEWVRLPAPVLAVSSLRTAIEILQ